TAGNLILNDVSLDGQTLEFHATAQVTVGNTGPTDVPKDFVIKFFEDRNANGAFDATDNVLGSASLTGIGAQTQLPVTAPLQGTLQFQSNLIYAVVDADDRVIEDNEANNLTSTAPPCAVQPTSTAFAPKLKWSWSGSPEAPNE